MGSPLLSAEPKEGKAFGVPTVPAPLLHIVVRLRVSNALLVKQADART